MSESDSPQFAKIIVDNNQNILLHGEYTKAVIFKLKSPSNILIFSDNLQISEGKFIIQGLHIWMEGDRGFSEDKETVLEGDLSAIDFGVQLNKEIVEEFDAGRFATNFPNIIRFLHTTCLYYNGNNEKIDHIPFVLGEILNRPVAVGENVVLIGDRLVVDESKEPIFYDCILLQRDETGLLQVTFEPFINIPLTNLNYIVLLGAENF